MKKILFASILAVLATMLLFTVTAFASDTGYVTTEVLNVRAAATTDSEAITQIYWGNQVEIIGVSGAWYEINYWGISAFVHSDYISVTNPASRAGGDRTKGQRAADIARQYLGTPYVYGGSSPSGFDCSGLTSYTYRQMGVSLNRTAASQANQGTYVAKSDLQPGDLVFFNTSGGISHVGIYTGNGNMVHSPRPGKSVEIVSINSGYYAQRYVTARRVV